MKILPLSILLMVLPLLASAQVEAVLSLGLANYQGDVQSLSDDNINVFSNAQLALGLGVKSDINKTWSWRADFNHFKLQGNDTNSAFASRSTRGFSFQNSIFELNTALQLNLFSKKFRNDTDARKRPFHPYLFAGAGVIFSNPQTDFKGIDNEDVRADKAAETTLLTLPVGGGLRFDFTERWGLALEGNLRLPVSDYYDGISRTANPNRNDAIGTAVLRLSFVLGKQDADEDGVADKDDKCPNAPGLAALAGCPDADMDGVTDQEDNCPVIAGKPEFAGCPDQDNDGIKDSDDSCPEVAGLLKFGGCPDSDADGIPDREDDCPSDAGLIKFKGCPDTDGDGYSDPEDPCPEAAGTSENLGCPDTDGDGIVDKFDNCPNERGDILNEGCPRDTDGDGIFDHEDACPEVAGYEEYEGCLSGDEDGDSVRDDVDLCPQEKGYAAFSGCPRPEIPQVKTVSEKIIAEAVRNIRFKTSGAELTEESKNVLNKLVNLLAGSQQKLRIEGHTDSKGTEDLNQRLSERRAKTVHDYFLTKGIAAERLSFKGYGESRPIADNNTAEGRKANRRVDLIVE